MFRYERLTAVNAGPFAKLDVKFRGNSVGIFGRNGAGKSSFLTLMYAAISGDYSRFEANKAGAVYNRAARGAESYVEATISNSRARAIIRRNLKGKSEMRIGDEKPITDAAEISQRVLHFFDADANLLDQFAFIPQDRMFQILVDTDSKRKAALQSLFRTEKCAKIHDVLNSFLNREAGSLLPQGLSHTEAAELRGQRGTLQARLDELAGEELRQKAKLLNEKSLATAKALLASEHRVQALRQQLAAAEARRDQNALSTHASRSSLETVQAAAEAAQAKLAELKPKAEKAKLRLHAWNRVNEDLKRRKDAETRLATARQLLANLAVPPPSKRLKDRQAAVEKQAKNAAELLRLQTLVKKFEGDGVAECPTCGTPVESLEETLAAARETIPRLAAELEDLRNRIREDVLAEKAQSEYAAAKQQRTAAVEAAEHHLNALPVPGDADEVDEAALRALVQQAAQTETEAAASGKRLVELQRRLAGEKAAAEELQRAVDDLKQQLVEQEQPKEKVDRARQRQEEHNAALQELARIAGEKTATQRAIDGISRRLDQGEAANRKAEEIEARLRFVERVRDACHWDGVPAEVSRRRMRAAEADIADSLELFGSPFTLQIDDDLSFSAIKPGCPAEPIGQLSTGQRCVTAISFWDAIGKDLGFLALDEPTANLDEDNRRYLAQALASMSAKRKGQRQLVIVTHDPNLRGSFDQVIDLNELAQEA